MRYVLTALMLVSLSPASLYSQTLEQLLTPKVRELNRTEDASSLQALANDFERIALAHPKSWHAQYYAAYAYTRLAYGSPKGQIDAMADRAAEFMEKANEIRPEEAENPILSAYLLGARIYVNPMFRGASMGSDSKSLLNTAFEREPDNPRAFYVRGMGIYNTPSAFGGGKKKAKPYLDRALEIFKSGEQGDALEPQWGHSETEKLLAEY